ncbi:MAG: hypothetical protein Q4F74_02625 [Synergistaceae bacterium]|nr:hypothetical protein [Synergistaceae bacterium]
MKKISFAMLFIMLAALPAFAAFGSKGVIPNSEPVEYRGLKVTNDGVNIIVINRGDKAVKFSATCSFVGAKDAEVGDFFIEEITLAPLEQRPFTAVYLKGDPKLCRKAETLRWTVYTLEQK